VSLCQRRLRSTEILLLQLGDPAHTNPEDPHEIVDGVNGVFAVPENRSLIIPVAIRAASMKVGGETKDRIDTYLQSERRQTLFNHDKSLCGPVKVEPAMRKRSYLPINRWVVLSLAVILAAANLSGKGLGLDGWFWESLNDSTRQGYVMGFWEGVQA
jgi:hypothetical protein